MSPGLPFKPIMQVLAFLLAGSAVGVLYFEALRQTIKRLSARDGWLGPAILTAGRIGGAASVLAIAAHMSAAALLVTFLGFLLARTVALYRARSVD